MLCFGEGLGWWTPFFGGFWLLAYGLALFALIVWSVSKLTQSNSSATKASALDIAKERYAKGEITKEEYENYRKNLS